jgi:hypothetical protein
MTRHRIMQRGCLTSNWQIRDESIWHPKGDWLIRDESIWHPKGDWQIRDESIWHPKGDWPIRDESIWHPKGDWPIRVRHPKTIGRSAMNRGVTGTADSCPASEDDWQIRDKSRSYGHGQSTSGIRSRLADPR